MSVSFDAIRSGNRPYVIAEIGVNYYDIARQRGISPEESAGLMVDAAADAGADAAKFQSYRADTLAVRDSPAYWDQSEEASATQHALFSRYDAFDAEVYGRLATRCQQAGIEFLSTPFDFEAADYLTPLCAYFKVSSSDITNWPFLEYIAGKGKPVMLSTGASNLDEIGDAVTILERAGAAEIALLHCILSYPTANADAHLRMIESLAEAFPGHLAGYSDHTRPEPTMTCLRTATRLGARILEKHFTLDKTLPGNDHYHAMDAIDLSAFRQMLETDDPPVDAGLEAELLGEREKRCIEAELPARQNARRSIVAARDLAAGEVVTRDALTFKRPGTGISPIDLDGVVGKRATAAIARDTIILREMIAP